MKLKEKLFLLFILSTFTSRIYSCPEKCSSLNGKTPLIETEFSEKCPLNETKFKQWLKDTLTILKSQKIDEYSRKIKVSDDSLSMDIKDYFSLRIGKNFGGKNKELLYALNLLDRNGLMPKGIFNLKLVIVCYYSISMVEQIPYEFDSEIITFEVDNNNKITKYKFLKGNLINKTSTFKE